MAADADGCRPAQAPSATSRRSLAAARRRRGRLTGTELCGRRDRRPRRPRLALHVERGAVPRGRVGRAHTRRSRSRARRRRPRLRVPGGVRLPHARSLRARTRAACGSPGARKQVVSYRAATFLPGGILSSRVEPLLQIAAELERRDADAAAALLEVEELLAEVREVRDRVGAAAAFLSGLSRALEARRADVETAARAESEARTRLREADAAHERAEREDQRLAAARAVEHARDAPGEAELRLAGARRAAEPVERQAG